MLNQFLERPACGRFRDLFAMTLLVTGVYAHQLAMADTPVGWVQWVDTGIIANSAPTGSEPPSANGQVDAIFYTNANGQLIMQDTGGAPMTVAGGSHGWPACWSNAGNIATCLADISIIAPVQIHTPAVALGHTPAPTPDPAHTGPLAQFPPPCATVDCQVQALPGNGPVNLYWYGVNYKNPQWQSLGSAGTAWYSIFADSKNVLHALSITTGYTLQERSMAPGGQWSAWNNLGGKYRGAPGCYQDGVALQCYAPTYAGQMAQITYNGAQWQPAITLNQPLTSTPSIVAVVTTHQDLFYDAGGHLMHSIGARGTWATAEDLGGDLEARQTQCFGLKFAIRCYAIFSDGHIWQRTWIENVGTILGFTVSAPDIAPHGSASLAWSVGNCPIPGCFINISSAPASTPQESAVLASPGQASGMINVSPSISTIYTLSVSDSYESKTKSVSLPVVTPQSTPSTTPTSTPIGYSSVQIWNCSSNGDTLTVWAADPGAQLTSRGDLTPQDSDGVCGSEFSGPGYTITLAFGAWSQYAITDQSLSGCTDNSISNLDCVVITPQPIYGLKGGPAYTINVDPGYGQ